jgi:hypothetical protein
MRAFESTTPRAMFESNKREVTGGCRKLHDEQINDLYSSSDVIKKIKPQRMRCAWHVATIIKMKSKWEQRK